MIPKAQGGRYQLFERSHDLAVGKSCHLHVEIPLWETLLLEPLVYRGDYHWSGVLNMIPR